MLLESFWQKPFQSHSIKKVIKKVKRKAGELESMLLPNNSVKQFKS